MPTPTDPVDALPFAARVAYRYLRERTETGTAHTMTYRPRSLERIGFTFDEAAEAFGYLAGLPDVTLWRETQCGGLACSTTLTLQPFQGEHVLCEACGELNELAEDTVWPAVSITVPDKRLVQARGLIRQIESLGPDAVALLRAYVLGSGSEVTP